MFEDIKQFSPAVRHFLIATFLMGLSNGMFDTVYNFYLEARGVDKTKIGYIYAVAMCMMAGVVIPLIYLSRRMSQKKLLIIFSFIYAVPFILLPIVSSVWVSAITLGLILSGMIALLSLGNSLTGSNTKSESRTILFSCFFVAYLGAAMIGSLIVGFITHYLKSMALISFQLILLTSFISSILMIYFRFKSIVGLPEPENDARKFTWGNKMEWRNLSKLFLASLFLGASITLIFRFVNVLFNLAYSMSLSEISLIMSIDKIISIVGALFSPLLINKLTLKPTIMIIGILTALCLYLQSLHISVVTFILLYFIRLLLNYCLMPLLDTLAITGFSTERTLLSTSVRQLAFYLGSALSAITYGRLLDAGYWEKALVISSIFAFVGTIFMSLIHVKNK
ncbi:MFS transporter [Providencia rettgeri]|uniref:MFS transporter n=1 Tax=Providencia rettgeri TaxID=587 RepID=UPI00200B9A66|nr:MFS transporter [Providencia rettgeri]UPS63150.1 MFS transporter [Providencia rettgeri]